MSLTFVVSTGRCGSTLLSRLLHQNPDILSLNELFGLVSIKAQLTGHLDGPGFWRRIADPVPFIDAIVRDGLTLPEFRYPYATGRFNARTGVPFVSHMTLPMLSDDPDALYDWLAAIVPRWPTRPAADHYRHLFSLLADRFGSPVVVERTGGSIRSVAYLHHAFPEARFIYLSREGADCAVSMSRHAGCRIPVLARAARTRAEQPWPGVAAIRPEQPFPAIDVERIMHSDIPLASFGEFWSSMTLDGAAELPLLPIHQWTAVRYEDLVRDPAVTLRRLASFLGAAAPPAWLSWAAGQAEPARVGASTRLPTEKLTTLRTACALGTAADKALHAHHSRSAGLSEVRNAMTGRR